MPTLVIVDHDRSLPLESIERLARLPDMEVVVLGGGALPAAAGRLDLASLLSFCEMPTPRAPISCASGASNKLVTADSGAKTAPSYTEFIASRGRAYGASRRRP